MPTLTSEHGYTTVYDLVLRSPYVFDNIVYFIEAGFTTESPVSYRTDYCDEEADQWFSVADPGFAKGADNGECEPITGSGGGAPSVHPGAEPLVG